MSKAQLEDGYTKIANELVDAMSRYFPGFTEGQIIWCVLRKTYGWNKKTDKISISQIMKMTGKSRRMVIYALKSLESKKMIVIKRVYQQVNEITFNKNHEEWVKKVAPSARSCTSATNGKDLVQHSVNSIPKVAPTKETLTKDNIQKKYISIRDLNNSHFEPIAERYNVPVSFVLSKYEDMLNWHEATGKMKKDWVATLRGFVKRDALKIRKDQNDKSKIAYISE